MGLFTQLDGNALEWRGEHEIVRIEAWGPDALRVRGTVWSQIQDDLPGALLDGGPARAEVGITADGARIGNGRIAAEVTPGGQAALLAYHRRRRAADRGQAALHRSAAAPVPLRRRRHAPLRGGVRGARRRALLRAGPAPARPAGPEGRRGRAHPAQHRGVHPVPGVQPGLRLPVEPPGDRPGRAGHDGHPVGQRGHPPVGLLDHRRGPARGRAAPVLRGDRARAHAPGMGVRLLAVQAPLPDPGRAARRGQGAQAARAAALGHRGRLLPLDPHGRLAVRPRGLAGPFGHGGRAERARREADGVGLAHGQPAERQLRRDGGRGPAGRQRAGHRRAPADHGHQAAGQGAGELLRLDQPPGPLVHLGEGQAGLLRARRPHLVAGRLRAGAAARAVRQPALPPRPWPGGREHLPAAARPGLLRGHAGRAGGRDRPAVPVGLGRQPALRRAGLVR